MRVQEDCEALGHSLQTTDPLSPNGQHIDLPVSLFMKKLRIPEIYSESMGDD